jgi:hypothetical protein
MANTLNQLMPDLYEALDIVSREQIGFIPAVTLDARAERASLNQVIRVPIAPASAAENVTPGSLPPDTGDQVIGNNQFAIGKSMRVPFRWTGEEQKGVNTGPGYSNIRVLQIAQAMRTLTNLIEVDVGATAISASRAYGTAGTTPFATDLSDPANMLKILKDNGAPPGDLHLIIDTTAAAKVRSLAQLTKANEAGTVTLREQGVLLDIHGFKLRESAGVAIHTKGTGASYTTSGTALPVGTTTIPLITGTGTVVAGDVVTFAGDTNKYVVTTGIAAPGSIVIAAPGLRVAIPAAATAMTIGANFTANCAFSRNAIVLATRAPALPDEGDMAEDRQLLTDPRSGLTFEIAQYLQYRRVMYEVSMAWGTACIKPEHFSILLG